MANRISNSLQVRNAVAIGPKRETGKITDAIRSVANRRISTESIITIEKGSTRKLDRSELLPQLLEKLKNADECTLIITDIGDDRPYKGEQIALDVKANSNATVVLITSNTACIGSPEKFTAFVKDRGFDPAEVLPKIDYTFHYTGVDELFPTIVGIHESEMNYRNDRERLILVFECKPNFYSGYLTELFNINEQRTHLLLARTYNEAKNIILDCTDRFAGAVLGMRNANESFELLKTLRAYNKGLPVIMQSSIPEKVAQASAEGSVFAISKKDPVLFRSIGGIIQDYFGFGDFIFRTPAGIEIGRAKTPQEFYLFICDPAKLDDKSLVEHASRNDFSNWLWLHGKKDAAIAIRPLFTEDAAVLRSLLARNLGQHI